MPIHQQLSPTSKRFHNLQKQDQMGTKDSDTWDHEGHFHLIHNIHIEKPLHIYGGGQEKSMGVQSTAVYNEKKWRLDWIPNERCKSHC